MAAESNPFAMAAAFLITMALILPFALCDGLQVTPNKEELQDWFKQNIGPLSSRKGSMDPALVAAESENPTVIKVSVDGKGDFPTIMDAVRSVPTNNKKRVVIYIGSGTYHESVRIGVDKPFVTLIGDPENMPLLFAGKTASKEGTYNSATVIVEGDYCTLVNLIIKNSSEKPTGKPSQQAVALRIWGDKAAVYNCKLYGFQDTVCDDRGMHLYKDCYIEGTVDFIFGMGKSIFLNTDINVLPSGGFTMITAHGRSSLSEDTGFSFIHCTISGTTSNTMLGRAWAVRPVTVFSYTQMSNVVSPLGWSDNFHSDRDKTVYFAEYNNMGPGSNLAKRVPFAKGLSSDEAKKFLTLDFIQASKWLLPPPNKP